MPHAFGKHSEDVTKARHSYRLRPGLARSGNGHPSAFRQPNRYRWVGKMRQNQRYSAYARARSVRTLISSTGRSGIVIRKVAPMVPSTR
jgi:hypothetical protein